MNDELETFRDMMDLDQSTPRPRRKASERVQQYVQQYVDLIKDDDDSGAEAPGAEALDEEWDMVAGRRVGRLKPLELGNAPDAPEPMEIDENSSPNDKLDEHANLWKRISELARERSKSQRAHGDPKRQRSLTVGQAHRQAMAPFGIAENARMPHASSLSDSEQQEALASQPESMAFDDPYLAHRTLAAAATFPRGRMHYKPAKQAAVPSRFGREASLAADVSSPRRLAPSAPVGVYGSLSSGASVSEPTGLQGATLPILAAVGALLMLTIFVGLWVQRRRRARGLRS